MQKEILKHYYYAKSYANLLCRDIELAEDITQDVFLKITRLNKKDSDFETIRHIKAYLKHCIKNQYIDVIRRTKNSNVQKIDDYNFLVDSVPDLQRDLSLSDEFVVCLELLPFHLKLILLMREIKDFSYKEIADELDMPIGTVKNRMHMARKELKELILKYRTNSIQ